MPLEFHPPQRSDLWSLEGYFWSAVQPQRDLGPLLQGAVQHVVDPRLTYPFEQRGSDAELASFVLRGSTGVAPLLPKLRNHLDDSATKSAFTLDG